MMRALFVVLATWLLTACGTGGALRARAVASSAQKPGQVAVYLRVETPEQGLIDLAPENFRVRENGVLLENGDIKLALLPRDAAVSHRALLLVDMSRTLSDKERETAQARVRALVAKLRQTQPVTVFAYDGAEEAHLIGEYPRDARAEPDEKDTNLEKMAKLSQEDSSSSLHSALLDALEELDTRLARDNKPVQIGTLIAVVQRPDVAGRAPEAEVRSAVRRSKHHFLLATLGDFPEAKQLAWLGRDGSVHAGSLAGARAALDDLAERANDLYYGYYLVAYCSPSREGWRSATIEVEKQGDEGKPRKSKLTTRFDSSGFGPGCDPKATPRLTPIAAAQREDKGKGKDGKAPGQKGAAPSGSGTTAKPEQSGASKDAPIVEPPSGMGYE